MLCSFSAALSATAPLWLHDFVTKKSNFLSKKLYRFSLAVVAISKQRYQMQFESHEIATSLRSSQ